MKIGLEDRLYLLALYLYGNDEGDVSFLVLANVLSIVFTLSAVVTIMLVG